MEFSTHFTAEPKLACDRLVKINVLGSGDLIPDIGNLRDSCGDCFIANIFTDYTCDNIYRLNSYTIRPVYNITNV